jgi:hypothetical protein
MAKFLPFRDKNIYGLHEERRGRDEQVMGAAEK